jgi:hypothetical protein
MKSARGFKLGSLLFCSAISALGAGSATAQPSSGAQGLLDDKWVFNLGAFVYSSTLSGSLNGQSSTNPEIDFDEAFGKASDTTRVRADLLWRITPEHRMRAMYFDNSLTRSRVLEQDIHWGDYTFNSGSHADLRQEFKVFELAYEYAFVRRPDYEVAATVGLHYMDMSLQLAGTASGIDADGNAFVKEAKTKDSSLPAPLPVLGLRAGWVVSPNWYVEAQGQFFKVKVGDYDGRWTDLRLGATWMFQRHFGVGLGYNWFNTRLDVTKNDFDGRLKIGYSGLQAYLTGSF